VKILLDTQCWLWMQVSPERLSQASKDLLIDPENELFLSAASAWEIAIKHSTGKLPLPIDPAEFVSSRMKAQGVAPLSIRHTHAFQVASLPFHHRDPFDRLLVAQAQLEGLKLMTSDGQLSAYEVEILTA
jgi:PIN domain nuclease of toxin-antitoxin system